MTYISEIDSSRFGHVIARAFLDTADQWIAAVEFCAAHKVELLMARVLTNQLALAQTILKEGGVLADTLCVFRHDLATEPPEYRLPVPDGVTLRIATTDDREGLTAIARAAFNDFRGHYHADPRLNRNACDALYQDWAGNLCLAQPDVTTWVFEAERRLVGFYGMNLNRENQPIGQLGAILPEWQGKGLIYHLMRACMMQCMKMGLKTHDYPTRIDNVPMHKIFLRLGCYPHQSYYTIHKWF